MIPLVVTNYSGPSNVTISASVIISFEEPEKLESPEQPENPKKSYCIFLCSVVK